jgi:predicted transcriptional regulator
MQVATGTVIDGKIVIEGVDLPDGETVVVVARETDAQVTLSVEEEEELLEAIAEVDRGDTITVEELLARLDKIR